MSLSACPLPLDRCDTILLGHGGGGQLAADLIRQVFLPAFDNAILRQLEDQATFEVAAGKLAFTTDSFVVQPLFFPGGDIGKLAICGTINDLAVGGARPLYVSAAFIIEEGLPIADLQRVVTSMRDACREAGVALVTGDTKVVDRGKGDKLFITTSGIGVIPPNRSLSVHHAQAGDRVIVSGTLGDHGMAIMSVREGLAFDTVIQSDAAPLMELTEAILETCPTVRCMRDPTRGGLAATLQEIANASRVGIRLDETQIPVRNDVRCACEIFGLDPLYVANEGKVCVVAPPAHADALVQAMRRHPRGAAATIVGEVVPTHPGMVTLRTSFGGERIVTLPAGEQLPRIC